MTPKTPSTPEKASSSKTPVSPQSPSKKRKTEEAPSDDEGGKKGGSSGSGPFTREEDMIIIGHFASKVRQVELRDLLKHRSPTGLKKRVARMIRILEENAGGK